MKNQCIISSTTNITFHISQNQQTNIHSLQQNYQTSLKKHQVAMVRAFLLIFLYISNFFSAAQYNDLHKFILESFLPDSSEKCKYASGSFNYSFTHSQSRSTWDDVRYAFLQSDFNRRSLVFIKITVCFEINSEPFEKEVFLAEMDHNDSNSNRSWSLRIGKGGNIYRWGYISESGILNYEMVN